MQLELIFYIAQLAREQTSRGITANALSVDYTLANQPLLDSLSRVPAQAVIEHLRQARTICHDPAIHLHMSRRAIEF